MKRFLSAICVLLALANTLPAQSQPRKKLLLLAQGPDGHPAQTHEYVAGLTILQKLLDKNPDLEVTLVRADEPWREGPDLLAKADGIVLYLSEGAKWSQQNSKRAAALAALAKRGGGISVLHWAMGTKDAKNIEPFLQLAGGCHGGPDRKYTVLNTDLTVVDPKHPITRGVENFKARDEFYHHLKWIKDSGVITPLLQADIDGLRETVAWAWQRPGGGRSFGFTGLHFHENWQIPEYRRLVVQGVTWTIK
jgi:type 1 glutamine amidotransferase